MANSRKFFGNGHDGRKTKPQQSTLAFNRNLSTEAKFKPPATDESSDEDVDMKLNDTHDKGENGEPDKTGIHGEVDGAVPKQLKREKSVDGEVADDSDDQPVVKRRRFTSTIKGPKQTYPSRSRKVSADAEKVTISVGPADDELAPEPASVPAVADSTTPDTEGASSEDQEQNDSASEEEEKPQVAEKKREKVQSTLQSSKDPYPDWKAGDPVPYAALCTTFSLIEMTTKRLIISSHCSLFLQQVLRLTPDDLLPTVQLMINKLAADYAGIELGIGESLIMKAIGESTGNSLSVIKADQNSIGDLGLVAAKRRCNQPTMFKPKPLTVRGVHEGLLAIAKTSGHGAQDKKVGGIKKLLSSADVAVSGKGGKGIDINKDKGGPSEAKFIIRFLEGKLRLGLAEKTIIVALAQAMVAHEASRRGKKLPSTDELAKGENVLKKVYRCVGTRPFTNLC